MPRLSPKGIAKKSALSPRRPASSAAPKASPLDEIKRFSTWLAQHDDDVVLSASARAREQELINKVTALSEEQKQQNRELQRKEKALAEAAALLVLTKKAQAVWGDKEK